MAYSPIARLDKAPAPRNAPKRQPCINARNLSVEELRRLAWTRQGIAMLAVDEIEDDLVRRIVETLATEMYGPRR